MILAVAYYFGINAAITVVAVAIVWTYRHLEMNPGTMRFWAILTAAGLLLGIPIILFLLAIIVKEFCSMVVWPWWNNLEWPSADYWPPYP